MMPQRLLAIELRTEIDRAIAGDARAERRALRLADENEAGVRSSHVRHNLKPWRLTWLARARARACQVDTSRSLGSLEVDMRNDKGTKKGEERLTKKPPTRDGAKPQVKGDAIPEKKKG